MKALVLLSTIFAVSVSTLGFASTEVGNGGDVVSCPNLQNAAARTAELLDYYEARTMYGFPSQLSASASVEDNLNFLLSTFAKSEPEQAEKLSGWANTFFQEAAIMPGVELVDIDDSKHIAFPTGCKVEQIIIQKDVEYSFDKRYVINKDLWDLLDNANRAGLIFHELLYRDAIAHHGLKNGSRTLRLVNGLVASDQFHLVEPYERVKIWDEFGFQSVTINGIEMDMAPSANIHWSDTTPKKLLAFQSVKDQILPIPNGSIELQKNAVVELYPSGTVKSVTPTSYNGDSDLIYNDQHMKFRYSLELYENGTIKNASVDRMTVASKKYGTLQCVASIINSVSLYEDGTLKSCLVNIEEYTRRFTGEHYDLLVEIEKNNYIPAVHIQFDPEGSVNMIYSDDNTPAKISGTFPIQGVPREVTSLYVGPKENYQKNSYPVTTIATMKNQETFRVRNVNIAFRPGEVAFYDNGIVAGGTLANAVFLEITAKTTEGKSVIPIAPYVTCGLFGTKSRPVPTLFDKEGKVRMGAITYPTSFPNNYGPAIEISGGNIFSNEGNPVRDEGTRIYWDSLNRSENYCD